MKDPFASLADFVFRWRWVVIAFWFILLNAAAPILAPGAANSLKGGGLLLDGTGAQKAEEVLAGDFDLSNEQNMVVLIRSSSSTVDDQAFQDQVTTAAAQIRGLAGIKSVTTYYDHHAASLVSKDKHATLMPIVPSVTGDEIEKLIGPVRDKLKGLKLEHYLLGSPAVAKDAQGAAEADLRRAELVTLPVVIIMLLIVFRTAIAAMVPLVLGVVSIGMTVSIMGFLGPRTDISIFALNVGSLVGLGLAIDYSLIILTRYREELADGQDPQRALRITMATAGRSIAYSALTVIVAMGIITAILAPIMIVRSISLAVLIVAAQAALLAMTLLPALMAVLKHRLEWLRVMPKPKPPVPGQPGMWYRFSRFVMQRPWVWLIACLVLMLGLASPVAAIAFGAPTPSADTEVAKGIKAAKADFPAGQLSPIYVVVESGKKDGVWQSGFLQGVRDLTTKISKDSRVSEVTSLSTAFSSLSDSQFSALKKDTLGPGAPLAGQFVNLDGDDNSTIITVVSKYSDADTKTTDLVSDLRADLIPGVSNLSPFDVSVGGQTATILDFKDHLFARFPLIALAVAAVILIILMMFFQSLALPVKAVILNFISIAATFGILSLVFQHGFAAGLLGFTSTDYITVISPGILYVILFALSTDYEVFMLSRVKEYFKHTGNNEEAVAAGLQHTAGIITAAGLILVLTFGSFVVSNTVVLKEIGLGLGLGVLIDSTIVRVIMVPATMRLLGAGNWYMPAWLKRIVPEISEEGATAVANYTELAGGAPAEAAVAAAAPSLAPAAVGAGAGAQTMVIPSLAGVGAPPAPPPPITGKASLVTSGDWNGVPVYELKRDWPTRFGRMDSNELPLKSLAVSKWHARIDFRDGQYRLTDLNSVNGVYVNGARIAARPSSTVLRPGDFVVIGGFPQVAFIFNVQE